MHPLDTTQARRRLAGRRSSRSRQNWPRWTTSSAPRRRQAAATCRRAANVLRAFSYPLADVRVLIVGQDPYPTPGHSIGLAFAVERALRPLPRSLENIFRELHDDLGLPVPGHGDLSSWAAQGVCSSTGC